MMKRRLTAVIFLLLLLLNLPFAYAASMPFETMTKPPEDTAWQALGDPADVYILRKDDAALSVRAQKKTSAKRLYSWKRFSLRAIDYHPEETWQKVALPFADGFVQTKMTVMAGIEDKPRLRVYTATSHSGYVYLAASGNVPLVADLANDGKHHKLLLPNDEQWQPLLLSLGAGEYTLSVYEAGLYDWPVRLLFETSFYMDQVPEDTQLALFSSLHTNMDANAATVKLAQELCKNAATDLEKITIIWDWLMTHAAYDKTLAKGIQFSEIPDGDAFIRGERGICCDYAAFMAVGLRAVGVPVKHIYGKNLRTGNQHAWNEVYLDGKWQIIDATMAQSRGPKKFHTENAKHYGVEKGTWDGYH